MNSKKSIKKRLVATFDYEFNILEFDKYRPYKKYLSFENAKMMNQIAKDLDKCYLSKNEEEFIAFCEKYDLVTLSKIHEKEISVVSNKSLTKYTCENGVVTIKVFPGDSWVKDIKRTLSIENTPNDYQMIEFHQALVFAYNKEANPIRKRINSYSMNMLEEQYLINVYKTNEDYIYFIGNKVYLYSIDSNSIHLEGETQPISNGLIKFAKRFLLFGWFFVITSLIALVMYFSFFLRVDVIAPKIEFMDYQHEIGDELVTEYFIKSAKDNFDRIKIEDVMIVDEGNLYTPGTTITKLRVLDSTGNKRDYDFQMTVVDTTKPTVTFVDSNVKIPISLLSEYDFMNLVERATDNQSISTIHFDDSNVDFTHLGQYPVNFRVEDLSGNILITNSYINVVDITKPDFKLDTNQITLNYNEAPDYNFYQHFTDVRDNYSDTTEYVDFSSYNFDGVGEYLIYYIVRDSSLNETRKTMTLSIYDDTCPQLSLVENYQLNVDDVENFDPSVLISHIDDNHLIDKIQFQELSTLENQIGFVDYEIVAFDCSGNSITGLTSINLVDTVPPVLELSKKSITVTRVPDIRDFRSIVSSLTDNYDLTLDITVTEPKNLENYPGIYNYQLYTRDQSGNITYEEVEVKIRDISPPKVLFTIDDIWIKPEEVDTIPYTYPYVKQNHFEIVDKITDNFDDIDISNYTFSVNPYDLNQLGVYELNYTVSDLSGNEKTSTFRIYVYEEEKPYLVLKTQSINISRGSEVNFLDYISHATDNHEGYISPNRVTISSYGGFDKDVTGTYYIRFSVFDIFNNEDRATLTVKVE